MLSASRLSEKPVPTLPRDRDFGGGHRFRRLSDSIVK